jgi:hypothetical protein
VTTIAADHERGPTACDRPDPPDTDGATTSTKPASAAPRWVVLVAVVAGISLAVPFMAMLIIALTRPWMPSADVALMELRTHDVGGSSTPLLGAYSRLGWNHPGPLAFWLLALPYRLAGASSAGLLVGTIAVHLSAVLGILALAWRRGGPALAGLLALAVALVVRGLGAGWLAYPWNPELPVLVLAVCILATWSVIEGDLWAAPIAVLTACYAWQSHVAYLPVTGVLLVATAVGFLHHGWRRRGAGEPAPWGTAAITVATAAVCVAPVLVEQLTTDPGNIRRLLAGMRHPTDAAIGLGRAAGIAAGHLSPAGTWLTGHDPINRFTGAAEGAPVTLLVLPGVAAIAAVVLARRAGAPGVARLVALTATLAALAVVVLARTSGDPYFYLFTWLRPIALVLWTSIAWAVITWARQLEWPSTPARSALARVAVVLGALGTGAASVASLGTGGAPVLFDEATSETVQVLGPAAVRAAAGQPRVDLEMRGGWCGGEIGHGVGLQLIKAGVDVRVAPTLELEYGPQRVRRGEPLPSVVVDCGPGTAARLAEHGQTPVAAVNLLTDAEWHELQALQQRLRAQFSAAGRSDLHPAVENLGLLIVAETDPEGARIDPQVLARFEELMGRGMRSAVVLYRPTPGPVP